MTNVVGVTTFYLSMIYPENLVTLMAHKYLGPHNSSHHSVIFGKRVKFSKKGTLHLQRHIMYGRW